MVPQAGLAVVSRGAVLTQADAAAGWVCRVFRDADIGVAVTLTPAAHLQVGDPVVIRLQHFRVHEDFVSECVQPNENNSG